MPAPKNTLAYKVGRSLMRPHRIIPFFWRSLRNSLINLTSRDQVEAHRRFIEDYGRNDPNRAVGSDSEAEWLRVGQLQFDYLIEHGVQASHQVLEIGCGNLKLGWRLIRHLEAGHYAGLEISSMILREARQKVCKYNLQEKRPYLFLVEDIDYRFLPAGSFDCITAHAVFVNSALSSIERVVLALVPLIKPGGFFDFTYYETAGKAYCFQGMYYYHRREDLEAVVAKTGLNASWNASFEADQVRVRLHKAA